MDALYVKSTEGTGQKATILFRGGMGNIISRHVTLLDHGRMPYAQYKSAVFIKYIEKRQRKPKGFVLTYAPYLVILEGWQHIVSQELFNPPILQPNGISIQHGKHSSCSDEWRREFESDLVLSDIIADYRDVNTMEIL